MSYGVGLYRHSPSLASVYTRRQREPHCCWPGKSCSWPACVGRQRPLLAIPGDAAVFILPFTKSQCLPSSNSSKPVSRLMHHRPHCDLQFLSLVPYPKPCIFQPSQRVMKPYVWHRQVVSHSLDKACYVTLAGLVKDQTWSNPHWSP